MCAANDNTERGNAQSRLDFTSETVFRDAHNLRQQGVELTEFERKGLAAAADYRRRKREKDRVARAQRSLARDLAAQRDPIEQVVDRLDTLIDLLSQEREPPRKRPRSWPASRPSRPPPPAEFYQDAPPSQRPRIDL